MTNPSRPASNGREARVRLVVAGRQGLHRGEATDGPLVDAGLDATRDHPVRVAAADRLPRFAQGVAAGRARGHDGEVGPDGPGGDGDLPRADVRDPHRDEERRDPVRAPLPHQQDVVEQRVDAAQTGPDDHAGPLGEVVVEPAGQPGLVERLAGAHERELDVPVRPADVLAVEDRRRVEVLDLAGDLRRHARRIELRDRRDPRAARDHPLPGGGDVVAQGVDRAHAGDHDAARSLGPAPGHRTSFPVRTVAAR